MIWRIYHKHTTGSTNADARFGEPGDVFTADCQTAGRGRMNHTWLSAPGENLLLSAVLDVADLAPDHVATLPLAVGLAVLEGLTRFVSQEKLSLKWPNDVLYGGRKICGILCERHGDCVVAGLGVNVRQCAFPSEVAARAVSLALSGERIRPPSVLEVREAVLTALDKVCGEWRTGGFACVFPRLVAHDFLRGKTLAVARTDEDAAPVRGLCGGIATDGSLMVGDTRVYAGEAHVLI